MLPLGDFAILSTAAAAADDDDDDDDGDDDGGSVCSVFSCSEEGSQLKLTEAAQAPLVKQNLDTNVNTYSAFFSLSDT